MENSSTISFIKEVFGVNGIQSPKQPQVLIFPENKAYPVKKLKKTISTNNIHKVCLYGYFINKANPVTISRRFIKRDNPKV